MNIDIPNYTLLKKLGAGAFAEVWLAEHRNNRRKAAVKILKDMGGSDDAEALFLREGEVLASFSERNIVAIFDNAKVGNTAYLIMEYLAGGSLLDRMSARGLEVGEAIGFVVQIAAALDAAHRQQIIHRDLKPANIMLRDATTPVLTDFGASRLLQRSTIYGKDGGVVGTPHYMSPEQITGQALDGRSDLYALGVMFHELLTGRVPFDGTVNEILALHLHGPLPRLPTNLAVLQPVLDRLLAKSAKDRYATGEAFADALRRCFLDQAALRQLVDFAPSSAWSSQLKALGFNLDTVERTEVRIAQGDVLKAALTQPLSVAAAPAPSATLPPAERVHAPVADVAAVDRAMPPASTQSLATTGPAPAPAATPTHSSLLPLALRTLSISLALLLALLMLGAVWQLDALMEPAIVATVVPAGLLYAVIAALAYRGRHWWLLGTSAVALLAAVLGLFGGLLYLLQRNDVLMPALLVALLLLPALTAWSVGMARRAWQIGVIALVVQIGVWITAWALVENGKGELPGFLLGGTTLLCTQLLLAWLTRLRPVGDPRWQATQPLHPMAHIASGAIALLIALIAAAPILLGMLQYNGFKTRIVGGWNGINPMGSVHVEFEAAGAVIVSAGAGQTPRIDRWSLGLRRSDTADLRLGEADLFYTAAPSTDLDGLSFPPSFYSSLSLNAAPPPVPLRLSRQPLSRQTSYPGLDTAMDYQCQPGPQVRLQLQRDGSGWLQIADDQTEQQRRWPLVWAQFNDANPEPALELVTLAQSGATPPVSHGRLRTVNGFDQAQLFFMSEHAERSCALQTHEGISDR